MSISSKNTTNANVPLTVKQAANNNDIVANVIFSFMTSLVILGSTYLGYYLPEYTANLRGKYPNFSFPEYSDLFIAFAVIPIFVVLFLLIIRS